jgi:hypothetical protein
VMTGTLGSRVGVAQRGEFAGLWRDGGRDRSVGPGSWSATLSSLGLPEGKLGR